MGSWTLLEMCIKFPDDNGFGLKHRYRQSASDDYFIFSFSLYIAAGAAGLKYF